MYRKLFGATSVALLICVSAVLADEVKGKATKVDADGRKITISVEGKDMEYTVSKDVKLPKSRGKGGKGGGEDMTLSDFAKEVERMKDRGGVNITAVTNDKKEVTEIKREGRTKGGDKKDKDK